MSSERVLHRALCAAELSETFCVLRLLRHGSIGSLTNVLLVVPQGTPGAPGGYYTAIPVPVYPPAEAPISIEGAIASQPVQVHFVVKFVCRAEHLYSRMHGLQRARLDFYS
jgi:hypothetical protein